MFSQGSPHYSGLCSLDFVFSISHGASSRCSGWVSWLTCPNDPYEYNHISSFLASRAVAFSTAQSWPSPLPHSGQKVYWLRQIKRLQNLHSPQSCLLTTSGSADTETSAFIPPPAFLLAPWVTDQRPHVLLSFSICYSLRPILGLFFFALWIQSTVSKHQTHSMQCPSFSYGNGAFSRLVTNYNCYHSKQICSYVLY